MTELRGIPSARIKGIWPAVLPFVRKAMKYGGGRWKEDRLLSALLDREMQLWIAEDPDDRGRIRAVLVTQIVNYPASKSCSLFLTAGDDLAMMLEHLPTIEAWAAEKGCRSMEVRGRLGWMRALPGYRFSCVTLQKELADAGR